MDVPTSPSITIAPGAGALSVPEAARPQVAIWLRLLREWNRRIDLTAARTDGELEDLMLADAALLANGQGPDGAPFLPPRARVIDVGTGAGAPGLALALMRPDLAVTLVEPLAKRASFLRTVIGTLGRTDVTLRRERVAAILAECARGEPAWDVAISRATLPPAEWVPIGLTLASATWVLLAREAPPACPTARPTLDVSYAWPSTDASRRAVRYVLHEATTPGGTVAFE